MLLAQDMYGGGPPIAIDNEDIAFKQYHFDYDDDVIDVYNKHEGIHQRARRKVGIIWDHFTNDPALQTLKSAICIKFRIWF